jgi:hypothetical protein
MVEYKNTVKKAGFLMCQVLRHVNEAHYGRAASLIIIKCIINKKMKYLQVLKSGRNGTVGLIY